MPSGVCISTGKQPYWLGAPGRLQEHKVVPESGVVSSLWNMWRTSFMAEDGGPCVPLSGLISPGSFTSG